MKAEGFAPFVVEQVKSVRLEVALEDAPAEIDSALRRCRAENKFAFALLWFAAFDTRHIVAHAKPQLDP